MATCIPVKESVFVGQSLFEIRLDTKRDLTGISIAKIQYIKPDKSVGAWDATIEGTELVYQVQTNDIDQVGPWDFRAYIEDVTGRKGYGVYFRKEVLCNPNT